MRPVKWTELRAIAEEEGCVFDRDRGDHYIMTKPGMARPVVIPRKKSLGENIVLSIARTLDIAPADMKARLGIQQGKGKPKKA